MRFEDLNYWHYLAIFFFAVGVVASLGEWVFHWWADPGQYVAVGGFALSLLSLGFGASKLDVRRMDRRFDRLDGGQQSLVDRQGSLVEGQRSLVDGQGSLVEGQRSLVDGQRTLIEGQARQATAEGQAEQTAILRDISASLREVVGSFRRPP